MDVTLGVGVVVVADGVLAGALVDGVLAGFVLVLGALLVVGTLPAGAVAVLAGQGMTAEPGSRTVAVPRAWALAAALRNALDSELVTLKQISPGAVDFVAEAVVVGAAVGVAVRLISCSASVDVCSGARSDAMAIPPETVITATATDPMTTALLRRLDGR